MKIILMAVITCSIAASLSAQGIKFEQRLSWSQLKAKAKAENKYIFVDLFATWCGPCKEMEKQVYPDKELGTFMNNYFLSIKVQIDTTNNDDANTKAWYADAAAFLDEYNVKAFPSYLFFSPDGKLVDRNVGYKEIMDFREMATNAMIAERQYYTKLNEFLNGAINPVLVPQLAARAKAIEDKTSLDKLVDYYAHTYFNTLPDDQLLTAGNIEFAYGYNLFNSKERIFQLLFKRRAEADKLMNNPRYSKSIIDFVITKEELYDKLWKDDQPITLAPDWKTLGNNIARKYGPEYANRLVPQSQFTFYGTVKNWKAYTATVNGLIRKYPPQNKTTMFEELMGGGPFGMTIKDHEALNEKAWMLFMICKDAAALRNALQWSELSLKLETAQGEKYAQFLDTKANLLYKLGKKAEAIAIEQEVVRIDMEKYKEQGQEKGPFTDEFVKTLEAMKKGEKTWKEI